MIKAALGGWWWVGRGMRVAHDEKKEAREGYERAKKNAKRKAAFGSDDEVYVEKIHQ